jgi:thioredoxin-like negative regulator of GroEL
VRVGVADGRAEPGTAARLGASEVPTVIFLRDRWPVTRLDGRTTLHELEAIVDACA